MTKTLLHKIFGRITEGGIKVVYWDGEERYYGAEEPKAAIIFNKPIPFNIKLEDPILVLGEAYIDEIIDFEGDLAELFRVVELNKNQLLNSRILNNRVVSAAASSINTAALKFKQKENIEHHYDLGNDFFSLWLDETMNYSCAYFETPADSLFQAQIQKVDHILKKLELKPGERLLDIGSGWGWLITRAAEKYDVQSVGITLSEEQYYGTQERIKNLGLTNKAEVFLSDYLDLNEKNQFDKIVSVGMFEHVGKENMPQYMGKVNRLLKDGGLSMLHTITKPEEGPVNKWITKYIFPGGYIPSVREIMWLFPQYSFHLIHAESLRLHYALTLDRWHENFNNKIDIIESKLGRKFVKMWSLYLMSCAASFRTTGLDIHQFLSSKKLNNNLPLTFKHIY